MSVSSIAVGWCICRCHPAWEPRGLVVLWPSLSLRAISEATEYYFSYISTIAALRILNAIVYVKKRSIPLVESDYLPYPSANYSRLCLFLGHGFGLIIHTASITIGYNEKVPLYKMKTDDDYRHGKRGETWSSHPSTLRASDGGLSWSLALAS